MGKLRQIRARVLDVLSSPDWQNRLPELDAVPPKELVGPLFACLLDREELVRWRTVEAFAVTAARLAQSNMEAARQLMRQLMWRLNEESGNIAWGIPETFGAILAAQPVLAREFNRVLASYIRDRDCKTGDNYLELPPLRQGVYWGLARLAQARPELALPALADLQLALDTEEPTARALAGLALAPLADLPLLTEEARAGIAARLHALQDDLSPVTLYWNMRLETATVADVVAQARGARGPGAPGRPESTE